jgi:hypothetical protein
MLLVVVSTVALLVAIGLVVARPATARSMGISAAVVAALAAITILILGHVSPRGPTGCVNGDPFDLWAGKLWVLSLFCSLLAAVTAVTREDRGGWWLVGFAVVATAIGGLDYLGSGLCNIAS